MEPGCLWHHSPDFEEVGARDFNQGNEHTQKYEIKKSGKRESSKQVTSTKTDLLLWLDIFRSTFITVSIFFGLSLSLSLARTHAHSFLSLKTSISNPEELSFFGQYLDLLLSPPPPGSVRSFSRYFLQSAINVLAIKRGDRYSARV